MGYQILFINPDRPEKVQEAVQKEKYDYVLLSDSKADAARAFGVAFRVDDATVERYKGFNIDLDASSGEPHHLLPVPSVFIFDKESTVRFTYVDPNYRVRIDPDLLVAAAKSALK